MTVEGYQGGKSPLDSVTCKSGKKLVKLRYHKDIFLACKGSICSQMGAYGHNLSKNDGLGVSSSKITASIRKKLVKLRNHSI